MKFGSSSFAPSSFPKTHQFIGKINYTVSCPAPPSSPIKIEKEIELVSESPHIPEQIYEEPILSLEEIYTSTTTEEIPMENNPQPPTKLQRKLSLKDIANIILLNGKIRQIQMKNGWEA
jgi:hypothetical protein